MTGRVEASGSNLFSYWVCAAVVEGGCFWKMRSTDFIGVYRSLRRNNKRNAISVGAERTAEGFLKVIAEKKNVVIW